MAITRVQGPANTVIGGVLGTQLVVNMADPPALGNTIIAVIGAWLYNNTVTSVVQTGVTWNLAYEYDFSGGAFASIWYGVVTSASADTAITITYSANYNYYAEAYVCEYSGIAGPMPDVHSSGGAVGGTSTNTGTTSVTTVADELFIGAVCCISGNGVQTQTTPKNGYTLLGGVNHGKYNNAYCSLAFLEYFATSVQNTYTGTSTSYIISAWSAVVATIMGAPTINRFQREGDDFRETKFGKAFTQ